MKHSPETPHSSTNTKEINKRLVVPKLNFNIVHENNSSPGNNSKNSPENSALTKQKSSRNQRRESK